jgi:hypothetical protein
MGFRFRTHSSWRRSTPRLSSKRCFRPLGGDAKYSREWLEPIGRLQEWLAEHARLDPRSEQAKVLLPELAAQVEEAEQAHAATVLAVSTLHFHTDRREPKPILARSWKLAEASRSVSTPDPRSSNSASSRGGSFRFASRKRNARSTGRNRRPASTPTPSAPTMSAGGQKRSDDDKSKSDVECSSSNMSAPIR